METTPRSEYTPEQVADLVAKARDLIAVRAERDRYRAAIEEARTSEWSSFGDSGTYRILTAALDETKED